MFLLSAQLHQAIAFQLIVRDARALHWLIIFRATFIHELQYVLPLFVCNSCLNLPALVSRWNKSRTKVPGIEALILSKLPLNYLSHRAGNARLKGGYQVLHCGTKMSVCSNLPPRINIQRGFSHFARLFVEYVDARRRARTPALQKGDTRKAKCPLAS